MGTLGFLYGRERLVKVLFRLEALLEQVLLIGVQTLGPFRIELLLRSFALEPPIVVHLASLARDDGLCIRRRDHTR